MAMNTVSTALVCSHIPWNGPLAAVQVASPHSEENMVVQPSMAQLEAASLSGLYVGTAEATLLADFQVSNSGLGYNNTSIFPSDLFNPHCMSSKDCTVEVSSLHIVVDLLPF